MLPPSVNGGPGFRCGRGRVRLRAPLPATFTLYQTRASHEAPESASYLPVAEPTPTNDGATELGYVLGFEEIDSTNIADVGGKGMHLGELSRINGIRVPDGFCVTTDAFQRVAAEAPSIDAQLDLLSRVKPDDRAAIRTLSADIRRVVEGVAVPDDLVAAISESLARLGEQASYAVRSSATAEDLPTASFMRPAGLVPEHRGPTGDPSARPKVLGLAVHRAGSDLPAP